MMIELTEEIQTKIVLGIEDGKSLKKICAEIGEFSTDTVYRWLAKGSAGVEPYATLRDKYARAHETHADNMLDEIIEISDNATDDIIFLTSEDSDGEGGKPVIKHSAIQRARLQIDTRKWAMSKKNPKKYGDKLEQNVNANGKLTIGWESDVK